MFRGMGKRVNCPWIGMSILKELIMLVSTSFCLKLLTAIPFLLCPPWRPLFPGLLSFPSLLGFGLRWSLCGHCPSSWSKMGPPSHPSSKGSHSTGLLDFAVRAGMAVPLLPLGEDPVLLSPKALHTLLSLPLQWENLHLPKGKGNISCSLWKLQCWCSVQMMWGPQ